MFKFVVWCVSIGLVRGGFFDLTDVEDPLALLWNLPTHSKLPQCKIDNNSYGTCMDKAKCILSGGTPTGHCGLLFTCCSYDTNCVRTSDKKQSYFQSGNLNSAVTNCKYTIKLRNKNVCQVRLDFEELTLAPAILIGSSTEPTSQNIFACANDSLRVQPNTYGVPVLCGYNSGQHLYIHVNQSTDPQSAVNIHISLANRLNQVNSFLPKPTWNIKFTQLECPLKKHKFDFSKYGEVENINNDFYDLAPQGAVQYFQDYVGQIRSIGFNTTQPLNENEMTSYPYREHYTIAFRRPTDVCGIKFTPSTINILQDTQEKKCYHYLYIPEYYSDSNDLVNEGPALKCDNTNTFYSLVPGPFYVNFKASGVAVETTPTTENQGFLINYELQTTCPLNSN